jgi:hypothetical protein
MAKAFAFLMTLSGSLCSTFCAGSDPFCEGEFASSWKPSSEIE